MKTLFLLLAALLLLAAACKKEKASSETGNDGIEGDWKLIERLMDPGDGSGEFEAVNEYKLISFDQNLNYECTSTTCFTGVGGGPSGGTYDTTQMTLSPNGCASTGLNIGYSISDNFLIISYPCFEGCMEKFIKIQ